MDKETPTLPKVKIREGLLQEDMEKYFSVLEKIKAGLKSGENEMALVDGRIVRAAVAAQWFVIPEADHVPAVGTPGQPHYRPERFLLDGVEVGKMDAGHVSYLANYVEAAHKRAYQFPKA